MLSRLKAVKKIIDILKFVSLSKCVIGLQFDFTAPLCYFLERGLLTDIIVAKVDLTNAVTG